MSVRLAARRRALGAGLLLLGAATPLRALMPVAPGRAAEPVAQLDAEQSRALRAWVVRIAEAQIRRGPTPRWTHRDCAGLVRFAVAEALAEHDARWRQAMGISGRLPPDTVPAAVRAELRHRWKRPDGSTGAYVNAIGLVQENSRPVGRDLRLARPADLLFFDQGDAQHLMLWTGYRIVYHNGAEPRPGDDGLRAVTPRELLQWTDTRWRPDATNPNFAGVHTLAFLA
ncbi:hypothetical protein dqs_0070 [Azoarcus olearius]|uniref:DUF1175 domain-containing protein n=1 Tax=Azoarcus sp. (strain BH72) TaxID=418699 RepID=UPI000806136D|nr:DUF1175 domain-containing protein [Azoarcus olearius]ANQ83153.1 hypothetical protein dqs_0070 [Azoarcus olearius]